MAEEDDRPEDADQRRRRRADAEHGAQDAAEREAGGAGDAGDGGQDREREEGAREEGQDGPELILPARVDGR